jgi:hypothetical protein
MTLFAVATNASNFTEETVILAVLSEFAKSDEAPSSIRICRSLSGAQDVLTEFLEMKKASAALGEADRTEWDEKAAKWIPSIFKIQMESKGLI